MRPMDPNEMEILVQHKEAEHRIKWQARNEAGKQALSGEFLVLNVHRKPEIRAHVEWFCADLNRQWAKDRT